MALLKIVNARNGSVLGDRIVQAEGFVGRLLGLLPKRALLQGEGLLLPNCRQIHMFGMRFPIDLIFVDGENQVLKTISGIRPWQLSPIVSEAVAVVELPSGVVGTAQVVVGDYLEIVRVERC